MCIKQALLCFDTQCCHIGKPPHESRDMGPPSKDWVSELQLQLFNEQPVDARPRPVVSELGCSWARTFHSVAH